MKTFKEWFPTLSLNKGIHIIVCTIKVHLKVKFLNLCFQKSFFFIFDEILLSILMTFALIIRFLNLINLLNF